MKYVKKVVGWVLLIFLIGIMLLPIFAIAGLKIGALICVAAVGFTIGVNAAVNLYSMMAAGVEMR